MKIPRYLVVALAITLGLVIWSQCSTDEEAGRDTVTAVRPRENTISSTAPKAIKEDTMVDLFPVHTASAIQVQHAEKRPPVKKMEPVFPLQVVGAWWENSERMVILSDGELSVLLCKQCRVKDFVRPGEVILPTWKLIALFDDHLTVEWQPEHTIRRIELGDLTFKPVR